MDYKFQIGDTVRVKKSVTQPRQGWGGHVSHESIGKISHVSFGKVQVDFPKHSCWNTYEEEIELVKPEENNSRDIKNLKVGDKIRIEKYPGSWSRRLGIYPGDLKYPKIFTVYQIGEKSCSFTPLGLKDEKNKSLYGFSLEALIEENCIEIINQSKTTKKMTNLKNSFALIFKSEPEKSFIETGIMDMNENLTEDGQSIFMSWLFKKNSEEFKKEVADKLKKINKKTKKED